MSVHDIHKNRFLTILKINIGVFIAELAVALYSNSLTMLSDSLHVSIHILAPLVAFISEFKLGGLSASSLKRYTAIFNTLLFFILAGFIANEAWERFQNPPNLKIGFYFFIIAGLGLMANIYSARILHGIKDHECSQNVKPLFWHMIFDAVGSVIVLIGAIVMYFSDNYLIDPILSLILSGVIFIGAIRMTWELFTGHNHSHHH